MSVPSPQSLLVLSAILQSPVYPAARGGTGLELRSLHFDRGIELRSATQLSVPLSASVPLGRRLFADVNVTYARTRLEAYSGAGVDLNGLTDTQVRAGYTIGRDAAVVSLQASIPAAKAQITTAQLPIVRSIAQNFVAFPISSYGAGFALTGAAAGARRFGAWNVGLAASLRYLSAYQPLADLPSTYDPGLEARLRLGVGRVLGERTTLTAAASASTFGTDEFTGAGTASFNYHPGKRLIGELALARQLGRSTLRVSGWAFFRAAGDSSGVAISDARENVYYGGVSWEWTAIKRLSLEPGLDLRSWQPAGASAGSVVGVRLALRGALGAHLVLAAALRAESGRVTLARIGQASLSGQGVAVFLRYR